MQFKEWSLLMEAGQTVLRGGPRDITVMFRGKPRTFNNVLSIDPRFEQQNIPKPAWSQSRAPKFMGEIDFALPLVNQSGQVTHWLNSRRDNAMSGTGTFGFVPIGIELPINWADHAQINSMNGQDLARQTDLVHPLRTVNSRP